MFNLCRRWRTSRQSLLQQHALSKMQQRQLRNTTSDSDDDTYDASGDGSEDGDDDGDEKESD